VSEGHTQTHRHTYMGSYIATQLAPMWLSNLQQTVPDAKAQALHEGKQTL